MKPRTLSIADRERYQAWICAHPQGSLWQSWEWKCFQEALRREVRIFVDGTEEWTASALVTIDRTSLRLSAWDIPRGPLFADSLKDEEQRAFIEALAHEAKKECALCLTFSPSMPLSATAFEPSQRHEQPEATRILDLRMTDEQLLAQMKPKGRYNISVAQRHGVRIERSQDIAAFHTLLRTTGERDGFGIRPKRHYEAFLRTLPGSFLLLAYPHDKNAREPVAGLLGVSWNRQGIYYYGASSYAHRALMAPYLLQWEAMRFCREHGCLSYDLLGVAPPSAGSEHPWAGVSLFKEKFGGTVVTYPPEQQRTLRPVTSTILRWKRHLIG